MLKVLNLQEKIWIAGHAGMVGQALKRRLSQHNLLLADRAELDLRHADAVRSWVAKHTPSVVFLTAAKVGGIKANSEQPVAFLLDNLKIQNNVIEAAAENNVKKLIFMGSACSYPKQAQQPIKESSLFDGAPEVTNIWYATAKLAGIKLAQAFHSENRLNCTIAMPTNSFGPFDNFNEAQGHVIPALMRRFESAKRNGDQSICIWGTGKPLREFIYVDDLADALIFLAENYDCPEVVNIGSGNEISIKDLSLLIANITGYHGIVECDTSKPDGIMRKCLNIQKIRN